MAEPVVLRGEEHATNVSRPYWEGLHAGTLRMQRCSSCDRVQHYPRRFCKWCGSEALEWDSMSGAGSVVMSTTAYRLRDPELAVPQVLVVVRLVEGPLILARIDGHDEDSDLLGAQVMVDFGTTRRVGLLTVRSQGPEGE